MEVKKATVVNKPWGHEEIFAETADYVGAPRVVERRAALGYPTPIKVGMPQSGASVLVIVLRFESSVRDRLAQTGMVSRIHVGVPSSEVRDRLVEVVVLSEVGGDRDARSGSGVRFGQNPPAGLDVERQTLWRQRGNIDRGLAVPQLADVKIVFGVIAGQPT